MMLFWFGKNFTAIVTDEKVIRLGNVGLVVGDPALAGMAADKLTADVLPTELMAVNPWQAVEVLENAFKAVSPDSKVFSHVLK